MDKLVITAVATQWKEKWQVEEISVSDLKNGTTLNVDDILTLSHKKLKEILSGYKEQFNYILRSLSYNWKVITIDDNWKIKKGITEQ